jgi:hypothetical protein
VSARGEIWVIDTSAVIEVRRGLVPRPNMQQVYDDLSAMVGDGALVFPPEVLMELEAWSNPSSAPDLPLQWARKNEAQATRFKHPIGYWKMVMTEAGDVIDPDKTGADEADPHILALSVYLTDEGFTVTVVTEDRKDRPDKISLNTACGILRVPCLPVKIFLRRLGIWPK